MHGLWNEGDVPNGSHVIVNIVCTVMVHMDTHIVRTGFRQTNLTKTNSHV